MSAATPAERPELHVVRADEQPDVLSPVRRETGRLRTAWTAADLMGMEFPPPRWAVPGIICEGVNLLAGPPKVGKSWLSLALGLAVAAGGMAFGAIDVQAGPVLYLALEDTPRRLQSRIGKVLAGQPAPAALTLATSCPPLPQGGDEAIATWLDRNRDARMVIIDVFAKMRGASAPGMSAYDADYAAVGRIKKVADAYGIAVLMVHHVRKAGSEDFLEAVSGTNGIAGAADATLVLKRPRGQADGVLHVTGRDVDEAEYPLAFDAHAGAWLMLDGPATDHELGDTRSAIIRHLRGNPGSAPKVIAEATGLNPATVRQTCTRMLADAQVTCDAAGRYSLPDTGVS
ncbi:AAA family ATPase [Phytohabitans sp. LJ34]|uniref:AAA family ATPase n=1 Tax=Phytohabitans sp. LJ34 TaxID=3452217 RepID=UPI003F89DD18